MSKIKAEHEQNEVSFLVLTITISIAKKLATLLVMETLTDAAIQNGVDHRWCR